MDKQGVSHPLRIATWMRDPQQLRQAITALNIGEIKEVYGFADPEEAPWVENLLHGLGGNLHWSTDSHQPTVITNPVATSRITSVYFRAVVKAGFHYFLSVVPQVRGSEPSFSPLRDFIISGGDSDQFVIVERVPIVTLPTGFRLSTYCHLAVAEWQNGEIQVRVQFFFGPDYDPPVYQIRVGEGVEHLKNNGKRGHSFCYFPKRSNEGYDGEASELIVSPERSQAKS